MRRRWMALIIALTIALAAPAVPAAAEETPPAGADLFDLYIYEGDGMTRVGCAAPLMDGILVTAATVGRRDGLAVSDGRAAWDAELAYTEKNGLLTVVFYDSGEHAPALGNYQLPPFGEALTGDSLHVRGGDDEGSRINRAVRHVSVIPWMGTECLLLNLSGPAEIGSAVLTDQGELAGILAAQYAEGENRYIAMTAESIYRAAAEAAENLQSLDLTASGPEGYTVTAEENLVTFDWSGMEMTPPGAHAADAGKNLCIRIFHGRGNAGRLSGAVCHHRPAGSAAADGLRIPVYRVHAGGSARNRAAGRGTAGGGDGDHRGAAPVRAGLLLFILRVRRGGDDRGSVAAGDPDRPGRGKLPVYLRMAL